MTKSGILKNISICILVTGLYLPRTVMAPLPPLIEYFVDDVLIVEGDCSQGSPCYLATALAKADPAMNIYLADGTYTGSGNEVVLITTAKVINLYGGWDGTTTMPVVRDLDTYVSIIDGGNSRRGISIIESSGSLTPIITGLTIKNGNANGVITSYCQGLGGPGGGCGGGIYSFGAAPDIHENKILNNVAFNASGDILGYGGGLYLAYAHGSQIYENQIYLNNANLAGPGGGGAIYIYSADNTTDIYNNQIFANVSAPSASGWGNGISAMSATGVHIYGNSIHDNGDSGHSVYGSAIYNFSGSANIENNLITDNLGGDAIKFESSQGVITRNRIWHNEGDRGVNVTYGGNTYACQPSSYLVITNNFIAKNGVEGMLVSGTDEFPACVNIAHNTFDGDQDGIEFNNYFTANVTNNIITNQSSSGILHDSPYSVPVVAYTLFYNNAGGNGEEGGNKREGDPRYVNPSVGDYHLNCPSPAYNTALNGYATVDIDGEVRPISAFADIGADECTSPWSLYLSLIRKP